MKIVIETPKFSFFKYNKSEEEYHKIFFSPIPTIFNYGYIEGLMAEDGMQRDAIVLGPRIKQGTIIEFSDYDSIVKFIDDSKNDDKYVFYNKSRPNKILPLYFYMYTLFKKFMYLIMKRKKSNCKFCGIYENKQNYNE